jgi:SAM-dependent methyltransferase
MRPEDALERAVAFLERSQLPSGELRVLASGKPDPSVFPTALAAYALSFAPRAAGVRDRALDFLLHEMEPRGLWKHWTREHPYHHQLPPDLDDTSCASAALARARRGFPDNRPILLRNRNRRGLFYTWKLTLAQLRHPLVCFTFFTKTSAKPFDVDAVVNANALHYLGDAPEVVEHLLRVLRENRESQCDKWYENPFAIWYFFSRALHVSTPEAGELIAAKIAAAVPSNALEHALAVCALRYWKRPVDVGPLLALQLESGAWPAAPLYHGGRARRRDGTFAAPHPDTPYWGSEELTTAFCVEALARV